MFLHKDHFLPQRSLEYRENMNQMIFIQPIRNLILHQNNNRIIESLNLQEDGQTISLIKIISSKEQANTKKDINQSLFLQRILFG